MSFSKTLLVPVFAAAALLSTAAPSIAQQTELRAGTTVRGPQGGEVGTIVAVDADSVTLRTDRHEVRLPRTSFAATEEGAIVSVTRDQLNADIDRMIAEANVSIVAGASVRDPNGAVAGTIESVDAEFVTLRVGEQLIRLPRSAVAPSPNGPVIGVTAAELTAQLGASADPGTAAE